MTSVSTPVVLSFLRQAGPLQSAWTVRPLPNSPRYDEWAGLFAKDVNILIAGYNAIPLFGPPIPAPNFLRAVLHELSTYRQEERPVNAENMNPDGVYPPLGRIVLDASYSFHYNTGGWWDKFATDQPMEVDVPAAEATTVNGSEARTMGSEAAVSVPNARASRVAKRKTTERSLAEDISPTDGAEAAGSASNARASRAAKRRKAIDGGEKPSSPPADDVPLTDVEEGGRAGSKRRLRSRTVSEATVPASGSGTRQMPVALSSTSSSRRTAATKTSQAEPTVSNVPVVDPVTEARQTLLNDSWDFNANKIPDRWVPSTYRCSNCAGRASECRINIAHGTSCNFCTRYHRSCDISPSANVYPHSLDRAWILLDWLRNPRAPVLSQRDKVAIKVPAWFRSAWKDTTKAYTQLRKDAEGKILAAHPAYFGDNVSGGRKRSFIPQSDTEDAQTDPSPPPPTHQKAKRRRAATISSNPNPVSDATAAATAAPVTRATARRRSRAGQSSGGKTLRGASSSGSKRDEGKGQGASRLGQSAGGDASDDTAGDGGPSGEDQTVGADGPAADDDDAGDGNGEGYDDAAGDGPAEGYDEPVGDDDHTARYRSTAREQDHAHNYGAAGNNDDADNDDAVRTARDKGKGKQQAGMEEEDFWTGSGVPFVEALQVGGESTSRGERHAQERDASGLATASFSEGGGRNRSSRASSALAPPGNNPPSRGTAAPQGGTSMAGLDMESDDEDLNHPPVTRMLTNVPQIQSRIGQSKVSAFESLDHAQGSGRVDPLLHAAGVPSSSTLAPKGPITVKLPSSAHDLPTVESMLSLRDSRRHHRRVPAQTSTISTKNGYRRAIGPEDYRQTLTPSPSLSRDPAAVERQIALLPNRPIDPELSVAFEWESGELLGPRLPFAGPLPWDRSESPVSGPASPPSRPYGEIPPGGESLPLDTTTSQEGAFVHRTLHPTQKSTLSPNAFPSWKLPESTMSIFPSRLSHVGALTSGIRSSVNKPVTAPGRTSPAQATSSRTANPPPSPAGHPISQEAASVSAAATAAQSSPSPAERGSPPPVSDTWLASTHLRAAAIKPELWGIEPGASYLSIIDCINHDMVALGMEANILWDATLLLGREGARACWRIKDLEETWQGWSQDLETTLHDMTNLLGDMRKLLDKKDRKIAEQSARLDAIEEYLRSKDPRAFHRSSQRDDSVDDEDYQTRDSSPNSTAGSDGGRDEGTEEELDADEQVDELDQEEERPDDALSRAESDSDGQHTPQALPAWAPLEELPSAPAFTHGHDNADIQNVTEDPVVFRLLLKPTSTDVHFTSPIAGCTTSLPLQTAVPPSPGDEGASQTLPPSSSCVEETHPSPRPGPLPTSPTSVTAERVSPCQSEIAESACVEEHSTPDSDLPTRSYTVPAVPSPRASSPTFVGETSSDAAPLSDDTCVHVSSPPPPPKTVLITLGSTDLRAQNQWAEITTPPTTLSLQPMGDVHGADGLNVIQAARNEAA